MKPGILFQLYFVFLKVGMLAFGGGLATLPLLEQALVYDKGWLTQTAWSDVITISNMTPGPIAINAATFVGTDIGQLTGGGIIGRLAGSIFASLGCITPQLILMSILAYFMYKRNQQVKPLTWAIHGLRSGVIGLIAAVTAELFISNLFSAESFAGGAGVINVGGTYIDLIAIICFAVSIGFLLKKVNMLYMLAFGAVFGVIAEVVAG
jgi:chromate transporter